MEFLKLLEGIRTPFFDSFFSVLTQFGDETFFILIGLLFFWCIDKRQGYYLLSVGFLGTVINQFLKLMFRIPRPWVRDPEFKAVESAPDGAAGYSFPSGHTQTAVGSYGAIARISERKAVRAVCLALCLLVPFSRMYLGVHTPTDVVVSFIVATALVFGLYPLVRRASESPKGMRIFFIGMLTVSVAYMLFVLLYKFPADADSENLTHGIKNAYKIIGCVLGLWLAFEIDNRYIGFDTKAARWAQILKLVLGLIPLLALKSGLKAPLYALLDGSYVADGIRYFLVVVFAGCIWPLTFGLFKKISEKKNENTK